MTALDILLDWLGCLQAQQTPLYLGQGELEHWPDGLLDTLTGAGLLHTASPANTLDCRGCAWGCHKPVQWYPQHPGSPPRAFILCDEEPAQGRIRVRPERLQQWQASPESLAKWLADQVNDLSQAELLRALPDLPLHKIFRLEGLTLSIEPLALHRAMPTPGAIATELQELPANRIYLNGDFWTVTFNGQTRQLNNTKGMRLIARLIQKQGYPCHVMQLEQDCHPAPPNSEIQQDLADMTGDQLEEMGLSVSLGGAGYEDYDAQARAAIKQQLRRLNDQIEDAAARCDTDKQLELENQRDHIIQHFAVGLGLAGRPRRSGDAIEKTRKRVQAAITSEIKRLLVNFPEFARHLQCLSTGTECLYQPEPPQDWLF